MASIVRRVSVGVWVMLFAGASLSAQGNVLLLIGDDLGVDLVGAYAEHPEPAHTPVLDALAAGGVLFRNAWASPTCSPTRAGMLTGRHGFRTGVGFPVLNGDAWELPVSALSVPKVLPAAYRSAAVGKWHLATFAGQWTRHPLQLGFEHHAGSMSNLPSEVGEQVWFAYEKAVDAGLVTSTTYATTDTVDDALALIDGFGAQPWFLWVAFNAPHQPFHHPPQALHGYELPETIEGDEPLFVRAATEAMDTEIGRLLASIDPDVLAGTTVIFVGDNGTHGLATTAPFDPTHGKGTLYEGGLNVPLIVKGPGVAVGGTCEALVSLVDLYATIAELAGGVSSAEDSVSLVPYLTDPATPPLRDFVFAEQFSPNGKSLGTLRERAARVGDHKLIVRYGGLGVSGRELYDLASDPFEQVNLFDDPPLTPSAQEAYDALLAVLAQMQLPPWGLAWPDLGFGLAGIHGTPSLVGSGTLAEGEPFALELTSARENATAALFLGFSYLLVPFKGGTLCPAPDVFVPLVTDAQGGVFLASTWPPGVPDGFALTMQWWIQDPAAPKGWSASNGLAAVTAP